MKALLISGSRNPEGRTARAAGAVLQGLASAGVSSERIFLPTVRIERCRQCNEDGWGNCRSEGRCIIEDDIHGIITKIREADLLVFATPVYFGDLSESIRAFTDRLSRCMERTGHKTGISGKTAIGICMAGGGGGGAPKCSVSLQNVLARCGFDVVDMILARRQNLEAKIAQLELVGQWLATRPSSK